jgi:hypothetical protein
MSTTRADRRPAWASLVCVGLVALAPAVVAHAEGVYGTVQLQYQKLDDHVSLLSGNNALRTQRLSRELWLRTFDLHHQDYLRSDLMMESNFRLSDQSFLDRGDVTHSPQGSVRLLHPWFQVVALHQPTSTTASLTSQSGLNPDSVTTRHVTTHNRESMVTGHIALPRWPQLDLAWVERSRDGAGSVGDRMRTRNARAALDRDRLSVYGSVNDQRQTSRVPGSAVNTQQVLSAGGSYRLAPFRNASLSMQYDFSDVVGRSMGAKRPSTTSHSAMLGGDWRPNARLTSSMTYQLRHIDFGIAANPAQTDHEAALMTRVVLARGASALAGGGVRTVRSSLQGGGARSALQKYVVALASVDTRVRRNWSMTGSASHTTSWDPDRGAYGVQVLGGSTRAQINRKLVVDGNLQISANGDTAVTDQRYSNTWTVRIQGQPLRTLNVAWSLRSLRIGPSLLRASGVSRGQVVDVQWRPVPPMQLVGSFATNGNLPNDTNRSRSRSLIAKYEASRRWQWYGSWTRSDQSFFVSSAGQLSSREVATGRVQFSPSRRLASSAGISYNEPGKPQESHQIDLALTWSFGR